MYVPKDAKCSETYVKSIFQFLLFLFFCEMVNFVHKTLSKLGLRDFCEPDSETLISDIR